MKNRTTKANGCIAIGHANEGVENASWATERWSTEKVKERKVTVFLNVWAKNYNDLYNTAAHNDGYVLKIFY